MPAQAAPSLDDPTTALERAIAALKAGDLAAFAREAQAGSEAPDPVYVPPASIYAMPEPAAPSRRSLPSSRKRRALSLSQSRKSW